MSSWDTLTARPHERKVPFEVMVSSLEKAMLEDSTLCVDTGHWQGLKDVPHTKTRELSYFRCTLDIPEEVEVLECMVLPNMPWAEDHFQERVSGKPLNPGEQYKNWPWYKGGVEQHKAQGHFSHTYMERYWPKSAGSGTEHADIRIGGYYEEGPTGPRMVNGGIRYHYGDLQDVVNLLAREPTTRQAYLPVWFPEDTGSCGEEGQRVPCSLGYHFMMRDGKLNCMYHMRSCDLIRYFRDDVYLTCRLVQWVLKKLRIYSMNWNHVSPGTLHMQIASLHIFEGDVPMLRRKYGTAP